MRRSIASVAFAPDANCHGSVQASDGARSGAAVFPLAGTPEGLALRGCHAHLSIQPFIGKSLPIDTHAAPVTGLVPRLFPPAIATGMNSPVSRAASEQSRARIEQPSTRLPDLRTEVWCAWTKGSPKLASKCGVCQENVASPRARVGWDCAASDSSIDHCAICTSLASERGLSQRLATNQASATAPAEKTISPGTLSHTSRSTTGCCMNSAERAYQ